MKTPQDAYLYDRENYICMDLNENYSVDPLLKKQLLKHLQSINRYPSETSFIKTISLHYNCSCNMMLPCNGSGEAISLLFQSLVNEKSSILNTYPTFSLYSLWCDLVNGKLLKVKFKPDLDFPYGDYEQKLLQKPDLAVFINPSYPYGKKIAKDYMVSLIKKFSSTLFLVDETYIDFGGESVIDIVNNVQNCMVIRSFSKAFGIAGLRLGVCVGPQYLIDQMKAYKLPFSVNSIALSAGEFLIKNYANQVSSINKVIALRNKICAKLMENGIKAVNTDANYIIVRYKHTANDSQFDLTGELKKYTILVKTIPSPSENHKFAYCRISVGSPKENKILIESLVKIAQQNKNVFDVP